jgi:Predicted flavoprotein
LFLLKKIKMLKIAIITGSTRPTRICQKVAEWVYSIAEDQSNAIFELVDIADYNLSMFDESFPSILGKYKHKHTKIWAKRISEFDGFIFVTPEYNHSITGALKNAIDFVYREWNNKSAGFVSYGATGGLRAVEHLRLILSEVQIAHVRTQVSLSLHSDFDNFNSIAPRPFQIQTLREMFEQVVLWAHAFKIIREKELEKDSV